MNKKYLVKAIQAALSVRAGIMEIAYQLMVVRLDDNCKTVGEMVSYPYYRRR